MQELAPPEQDARVRLTEDEAQALVLRTVATEAEALLRTAYRYSLCADDAHDAYQRGMEIFMRRARTLDPALANRWIHVVVKHEAMEVRRTRSQHVALEEIDFDRHEAPDVSSPEERVLSTERATRAAEALRRLKPQELRTMWLKALGHSYAEIGQATGYSHTKVNRCLAEGRKSFLSRFEGIETGEECRRWQAVLSAMVDGEATAAQLTDVRPHLRNCPACRATLKGLHQAQRPLAAVLPIGFLPAAAKLSGLLERVLPGGDGAAVGAAGGAGLLGVGGAKLAGLLAVGVAATAGGGLVVAHERQAVAPAAHRPAVKPATVAARASRAAPPMVLAATAIASRRSGSTARSPATRRLVARRHSKTARVEFRPAGAETPTAAPATTATAHAAAALPAEIAHTPPAALSADTTRGEFAPRP
jgi:RNA polymerase sigma factor (sigma-70 family)